MRPFNNYKRTKYWRGSGNVWPTYGVRECDCHVCRAWQRERIQARKASRQLHRRVIVAQLNDYEPEYDAAMGRLLDHEVGSERR